MKKKLIVLLVSIVVLIVSVVGVTIFNYQKNKSEWTLERLIEESDCCVGIKTSYKGYCNRAIPKEPLKEVYEKDGKVYQEVVVSATPRTVEYFDDMEITIIQENENYLNEHAYIVFLTKAEEDDCYYILGGKNGVIKLVNYGLGEHAYIEELVYGKFRSENKVLEKKFNKKFKDFTAFWNWAESEDNVFSDKMIPKEKPTLPQIDYSNIETTAAP
ncbi:MAG: hypothetical protein J6V78_04260 [Clostridia bacterium]|nr:hypothetical protein [Clostridia bacterium]